MSPTPQNFTPWARLHSRSLSRAAAALFLSFAIILAACQTTVPGTGRKQLNFLDPAEEAAMGFTEFDKMKRSMKILTDPSYNEQVQRVGQRLSKVMPVPNAEWEFVVFDDDSPNAFALPGGKVGVHTGLFEISQNDAGLATVIGYEVGHVVARHSGEKMSRDTVSLVAVAGAGIILGNEMEDGAAFATAALADGTFLNRRAFSRKQEPEADRMGAIFMARAGYNPEESVALWQRFSAWRTAQGQSQSSSLLSTHPLDEKRISELQRFMPEAKAEYRPWGYSS